MPNKITHAESVSSGHPDKVADQISDALVDMFISKDPKAHTAIETVVSRDTVHLFGEVRSSEEITLLDMEKVVRDVVSSIGYKSNLVDGFDSESLVILNYIHTQSPEIALGVDQGGAGDQGIMYGSATEETPSGLPLCQKLANDLMETYDNLRFNGNAYLKPDAKALVVVSEKEYKVEHITLALSHTEDCPKKKLVFIADYIISKVLSDNNCANHTYTLTINGAGSFVECGPGWDTGLTGRKIVVDQVAGFPIGGGALSGKDPSKVDRSAAYFCRYLAKHLVVAGVAHSATVGLSFTIGKPDYDALSVTLVGNKTQFSEEEIANILPKLFPSLSPTFIAEHLGLYSPIYRINCNYSHYSKDMAPWETINEVLIELIRQTLL